MSLRKIARNVTNMTAMLISMCIAMLLGDNGDKWRCVQISDQTIKGDRNIMLGEKNINLGS